LPRGCSTGATAPTVDVTWEEQFMKLEAEADAGNVDASRALFEELRASAPGDLAPDRVGAALWGAVLWAHAIAEDFAGAEAWYREMQDAGVAASTNTLQALAESAAHAGQLEESVKWLQLIRAALPPPAADDDAAAVARRCWQEEALALAGAACAEACTQFWGPEQVTVLLSTAAQANFTSDELGLASVLDGLCRTGNIDAAAWWLNEMKLAGLAPSKLCYTIVVDAYTKAGDKEVAARWADEMAKEVGSAPLDVAGYNRAIRESARARDAEGATAWLTSMEEAQVDPDQRTLSLVIQSFARAQDAGGASWWLSEMKQRGLEPREADYANVISSCGKAGHTSAVMRWFTEMGHVRIDPSVRSYNAAISACARQADSKGAIRWLQDMTKAGLVPDKFSYTSVMQALVKKGDPRSARKWLNSMIKAGFQPDTCAYNTLVSAYAKLGHTNEVEEVMRNMREAGIALDTQTWNWAIIAYNRANQLTKAGRRGSYMGPEEAFRKMVASGVMPNNFTLSALDGAVGFRKRIRILKELKVDVPNAETVINRRLTARKRRFRRTETSPYADGGPEIVIFQGGPLQSTPWEGPQVMFGEEPRQSSLGTWR